MDLLQLRKQVSVIIPTRGRRWSLLNSIHSALTQPETAEVIIVYNGGLGDPDLLRTCRRLDRVTVVARDDAGGCGPARQIGVEMASEDWIAFLDDDDVWMPHKLRDQLRAAHSGVRLVISRAVWESSKSRKVLPARLPTSGETLSDFAFVVGRFGRHGVVSPPTLLISASLLREVPWWMDSSPSALDRHEDMQWVVRASDRLGAGEWLVLPEVATWVDRTSSDSMFANAQWNTPAAADAETSWLQLVEPHLSRRAIRHFRLTHIWPHERKLGWDTVVDAALAPWAALVGGWRRTHSAKHVPGRFVKHALRIASRQAEEDSLE